MTDAAAAGTWPSAPGVGAARAFARLEGSWTLSRTIPGIGWMTGQAVFRPYAPRVLRYREDGLLELASGYSGPAFREYYYLLEDDHIRVAFADAAPGERTYLRLRVHADGGRGELIAADDHLCVEDLYSATYAFEERRLTMTVDVRGPAKDYTIRTTLTRD